MTVVILVVQICPHRKLSVPDVVAHTFNPRTQEAEARRSEFEANLLYILSSRTAKATQRNPVSIIIIITFIIIIFFKEKES